MSITVTATNIDMLWQKTMLTIKEHGEKISGIQEIPNLVLVLTENFRASKFFDKAFREAYDDDRIDYAESVTFVQPEVGMAGFIYQQNDPNAKWTNTYWGRMINWHDEVNQIEAAIKKLQNGKNTKMISIGIYDPKSDHKKVMGGVPCMSSIDIKPRNGKLHLTAFFRSMRFSKAGYADVSALCKLGQYLCDRSRFELGSITCVATSGHIFYSGDESKQANNLLEALAERRALRKSKR